MDSRKNKRQTWTALVGGTLNNTMTDGLQVRRDLSPWSTSVHKYLTFLNQKKCPLVPKLIKVDSKYEYHEKLPGTSLLHPWPDTIKNLSWMKSVAHWLKEYHAVARQYKVQPSDNFLWEQQKTSAALFLCHGDLGPWNFLVSNGVLSGVIDWDLLRPGEPIDDLAQIAIEHVPLRPPTEQTMGSDVPFKNLKERLKTLCIHYDALSEKELLKHCIDYCTRTADEIDRGAQKNLPVFLKFKKDGEIEMYKGISENIRKNWLF